MLNDQIKHDVHFTVECHGRITVFVDASHTTFVSSHWIHSCLEVYTSTSLSLIS